MRPLLSLVAVTACAAAVSASDATFIIPHGHDAPVAKDLAPAQLAWNHATLGAVLEAAPDAPGKAETLAAFALAERGWSGENVAPADIVAKIAAAMGAGSQDAMLQYLDARFRNQPQAALVEPYRAASAALDASNYPPVRKAFAATRLYEALLWSRGPHDDMIEARDHAEKALVEAMAAMADDERGGILALYGTVHEFLDTSACDRDVPFGEGWLRDLDAAKAMPAWWRDMAAGVEHINLAWSARGSGWANTVTEEGWKGFGEHLAAARGCFGRAAKAHPDRPEPMVEMITVAMGGADEDGSVKDWFERAVAARMDCIPAFDRMFGGGIQPRWGGSHELMLALGEDAAATERFDTDVPWQMLIAARSVYWDARSLKQERPQVLDAKVYARCRAVIDGYVRFKERDEAQKAWYASQSAALAWACDMPQEALRQLDLAGDRVAPACFDILGMTPAQLREAASKQSLPP